MYDRDEWRERERERESVLAARHDDEDDDDKSPFRIHSVRKQTSGSRLPLRLKPIFIYFVFVVNSNYLCFHL